MKHAVLLLVLFCACATTAYKKGMHREDVYDRVDQLEMDAYVSELRLGPRYDVIIAPQGGSNRRIDEDLLRGGRTTFGRFRPTDTESEQYRVWLEEFHAVRLWHAIILEDLRVTAVIDDEIHDRLIDRVGAWMQDHVDERYDISLLDVLRVKE